MPAYESEAARTEASLRGRLAVLSSWAQTDDRQARTKPGRDAMLAKFEQQVDPDGTLPPAERARRAEYARKAHFTRLALKAAKARSAKAAARRAAADATTADNTARRLAELDARAAGADGGSS